MPDLVEPTWLSLLPAIVTIALAFLTRQVLPALFAGVVTGSVMLALQSGRWEDANFITRLLFPSLASEAYAQILLIYLWCLGGLIGVWEKTGGARHFAEWAARRFVRGPRSALLFGWGLGLVFHQGGTVSTVLTASTARPVADRHRVSHEELAYVVDSTASPIATLIPVNAWPLYVAGLVAGTIEILPDTETATQFFYRSLRFNFYAVFAVLATLALALELRWLHLGALGRARKRARETGALDAEGSQPLLVTGDEEESVAPGYRSSLADFFLPLGVLLGIGIPPMLLGVLGLGGWLPKHNWINEAFLASALTAMGLATAKGMPLAHVLDGFVRGCQKMTIGAIVLGLAVTLGTVARELHTADYLVHAIGALVSPIALPALLTLVCMAIAFATGTSWGTYAVVFPVAMPLAWAVHPDPVFVQICFGAVLGGAVYGDQCSPISDTTILSSMFTGCDLMDHVRTQLPLASVAAAVGIALSTIAVWLG